MNLRRNCMLFIFELHFSLWFTDFQNNNNNMQTNISLSALTPMRDSPLMGSECILCNIVYLLCSSRFSMFAHSRSCLPIHDRPRQLLPIATRISIKKIIPALASARQQRIAFSLAPKLFIQFSCHYPQNHLSMDGFTLIRQNHLVAYTRQTRQADNGLWTCLKGVLCDTLQSLTLAQSKMDRKAIWQVLHALLLIRILCSARWQTGTRYRFCIRTHYAHSFTHLALLVALKAPFQLLSQHFLFFLYFTPFHFSLPPQAQVFLLETSRECRKTRLVLIYRVIVCFDCVCMENISAVCRRHKSVRCFAWSELSTYACKFFSIASYFFKCILFEKF